MVAIAKNGMSIAKSEIVVKFKTYGISSSEKTLGAKLRSEAKRNTEKKYDEVRFRLAKGRDVMRTSRWAKEIRPVAIAKKCISKMKSETSAKLKTERKRIPGKTFVSGKFVWPEAKLRIERKRNIVKKYDAEMRFRLAKS